MSFPPSSPKLPSSFDPAIHLHSELDLNASNSADLEELNTHIEEVTAQKSRAGIVIQHRAWKTSDAFRSDQDHAIDTPVKRVPVHKPRTLSHQSTAWLPSSPPAATMFPTSSPVLYPATSSPAPSDSPRKRRKLSEGRSPLKDVNVNTRMGGFVEGDSDEEPSVPSRLFHKKPQAGLDREKETTPTAKTPPESVIRVDSLFDDNAGKPKAPSDSAYASEVGDPDLLDNNPTPTDPAQTPEQQSKILKVQTCSGRSIYVCERRRAPTVSYEQLVASRSKHVEGHAKRSYYGIDIHELMDENAREDSLASATANLPESVRPSVEEPPITAVSGKKGRTLMWTEKYRARKFTDLVGDERTHRSVLRWLKGWDSIVFPGSSKPRQKASKPGPDQHEDRAQRKILLLTGPPGLGKTTLAHVCARQAGYEVQEINASDERSRDVVRGRIRDMVGTENVRGTDVKTAQGGKARKAGRPVCVVVDEVDGVVGGSGGGGEGGFIKALIDLITLDQKNTNAADFQTASTAPRKKKGDKFRMLRPLILICNDVYHPSLRPLRQGSFAEVIHIRKPALNMVVSRVHSIFEKEGVPSDVDGVRRLCEATWGVSNRKEGGTGNSTGEGDIRSVMVVGEWVATKLRASATFTDITCPRLTRKWIETHILGDLGHGGGAARSLGRGGAREVVERVFQEGAGFPKSNMLNTRVERGAAETTGAIGVAESAKRRGAERLREMIDTSGETDRIVTDCFTSYPAQPIQDDTHLSKPNAAYDWLHFYDALSSQLTSSQDWELAPYMSSSILAFHHLFASAATARSYASKGATKDEDEEQSKNPFSGPSAPFTAAETLRANTAAINTLQNSLSLPLARMYRAPADIATELLPYTLRMLAPDVKPVVINSSTGAPGAKSAPTASVRKASEKALVNRAVECMAATGVRFEKSRVEQDNLHRGSAGGWVYRMEPPLDVLGSFETMKGNDVGVRYAVRQVLEMEWRKETVRRGEETRMKRMSGKEGEIVQEEKSKESRGIGLKTKAVKRDFFGRIVKETVPPPPSKSGKDTTAVQKQTASSGNGNEGRVWVSFNEGFSNAVRKPVTLKELMDAL